VEDSNGDGTDDQITLTWDAETSLPQEDVLIHARLYDSEEALIDERIYGPYTIQGEAADPRSLDFYLTTAGTYHLSVDLYSEARRFAAAARLADIVVGAGPGWPDGVEKFVGAAIQLEDLAAGSLVTATWQVITTLPQESVSVIAGLKDSTELGYAAIAASGSYTVTETAPATGTVALRLPEAKVYDLDLRLVDSQGHLEDSLSFSLWATGHYADRGLDENDDGRYESLIVDVGVNIPQGGMYTLRGSLYDSTGGYVTTAALSTTLSTGEQNVSLAFDGAAIFKHKASGTFRLRNLELQSDSLAFWGLIADAYTTSAYDYTQFANKDTILSGSYNDAGVDEDGDGLFNYLALGVGLQVTTPGLYTLEGSLFDSQQREVERQRITAELEAGAQILVLKFPGWWIFHQKADGPYTLRNLSLLIRSVNGIDVAMDYEQVAYVTQPYVYTQFEQSYTVHIPLVLKAQH
jgi:hypothetical protein